MDYEVTLAGVKLLGIDCRTFRFTRPPGFVFDAGQYFILRLDDKLVKPFSFSSSPTEGDYLEFTTKMSGSDYKRKLESLKPGGKVKMSGPMGKFTYGGQGKVVFLAGGIGITPFRSMAKYIADSKIDCDIVIIWGVNTIEDAIFKDFFDTMTQANPRLKVVYVPVKPPGGWTGLTGFICEEHLQKRIPDPANRTYFICGPPKMVEAMGLTLKELKVPSDKVVVEKFG
jgi:glycine betaine catabolism B